MAARIADDQQTRLSMGTAMQSTAGSALQSLMSKGGKSPATSPKSGALAGASSPTKASDQRTVVSSATQLKSTSKAGALLNNLVSPKSKAATEQEPVKPTHSDRAREQAEAKIPLLADPHNPSIGLAKSPEASLAPHHRPADQSVRRCDGGRILRVVGAICILTIVGVVAGVVFLVKPKAQSPPLRKGHVDRHSEAKRHASPVQSTEAPSTAKHKPFHTTHEAARITPAPVHTSEAPSTSGHSSHTHQADAHHAHRLSTTSKKETPSTSSTSSTSRRPSKKEQQAFAEALQPFIAGEAGSAVRTEGVVYFDCNDKEGLRLNQWAVEHIKYCCLKKRVGCDVVPSRGCTDPEALSDWSGWSDSCNACGGGHRDRHRRFREAFQQCEVATERRYFDLSETQRCPTVTVGDFLSTWSAWGSCSVTCGSGHRKRVRTMTPLASRCKLEFPLEERQACTRPTCHAANDAAK